MSLDEFIRTRITAPLGLKDTHFFMPPTESNRLAAVYATSPDGRLCDAPRTEKDRARMSTVRGTASLAGLG